jgi:peptidoglycan/xylan/chitin deacetylase (PgdA/CDA1 family)
MRRYYHLAAAAIAFSLSLRLSLAAGNSIPKSSQLVLPGASVSDMWEAPNKLNSDATLLKLKSETSINWTSALGEPTEKIERYITAKKGRLGRNLPRAVVFKGATSKKVIALTFDDGPHPFWTRRLIGELKAENLPATFFVVGRQAEKYPELLQEINDNGFTIGNHTYDHLSLLKIPRQYLPAELIACSSIVKDTTGTAPMYFRPPGGEYDDDDLSMAEALGMKIVLWTDDPGDFAKPPASAILKRVLRKATPGGIILLHDGIGQTLTALPEIVKALRSQGYEFVSLERLIKERAEYARDNEETPSAPLKPAATKHKNHADSK